MQRLRRHRLALLATLFAMVAFVAGSLAQHVHVLRVAHVTCVEHGDVLELDEDAGLFRVDGARLAQEAVPGQDVASSPAPGSHDHDCPLTSTLSHPGTEGRTVLSRAGNAWTAPSSATPQAPRAPPLRWAPKTSPPTIG